MKYNKKKKKSLINFQNKKRDNIGIIAKVATFTTRNLNLPGINWWQEYVIAYLKYVGKRNPNKQKLSKILKTL